jgi:hypothetical protein
MMIGYDIYDGAFSIASKNDLDDQNLLLATAHRTIMKKMDFMYYCFRLNNA